ncbi:MAG TPA: VOC family protein, partial [Acidimicrobiales bacterium]|nr:VOC family protein [Acidimicrobiales bacterium]
PAPVRPVLNHVAISVDAAVLDEKGRAALIDFYGEVFGWVEGDNSTEKGNPLIMYTGALRQFLYLLPATGDFLRAPPLDHFGLEVRTLDELVAILDRAKDDRVTIIDIDERVTHGTVSDFTLTNAYIGFLIPLMIELQHITERVTG